MSGANWNALNPVTTSKAASAHGNRSSVPTRRSAPGTAACASAIIASAASMPWTTAPRPRARARNSPLPQATSSSAVSAPTSSAASTASHAGRESAAKCSARTAAPADHRRPYSCATLSPTTPHCRNPRSGPDRAPHRATRRRARAGVPPSRKPRLAVPKTATRRRGCGDSPSRSAPCRRRDRSSGRTQGCAVRRVPSTDHPMRTFRTPAGVHNLVGGSRFGYAQGAALPTGALPDRRPEGICGSTPQARPPSAPLRGGPARVRDSRARCDRRRDRPRRQRPVRRPRHHDLVAAAHRTRAGRHGRGRGAGRAGVRRAAGRGRHGPRERRAVRRGTGPAAGQAGTRGPRRLRHIHLGSGGVKPYVRSAAQFLGCRFGEPTMYGVAAARGRPTTRRAGPSTSWSTAPPATRSPRALDNRAALGITYVIWRQRINFGNGWSSWKTAAA